MCRGCVCCCVSMVTTGIVCECGDASEKEEGSREEGGFFEGEGEVDIVGESVLEGGDGFEEEGRPEFLSILSFLIFKTN